MITVDILPRLKAAWFERFDRIVEFYRTLPSNNLHCLERCQAMCCPHVEMRRLDREQIASPVVVLLPFEMEYILEHTGVPAPLFRKWPVEIAPGVIHPVGMLDLGKPCPFLMADFHCRIQEMKPVDCRSFPLMPTLNGDGELDWVLGEKCPTLNQHNPKIRLVVEKIWIRLFPNIPADWWLLYDQADDWYGWPEDGETLHGRRAIE